jgi:hypothetical protein
MPLGEAEQARISEEQSNQMATQPAAPASGQGAVEKAADEGALAGAESAAPSAAEDINTVRIVGSKAFVSTEGVWIDTAYDPDKMKTIKVAFLSEDYFALAAARPALAAAFALGTRVIALDGGEVYEVVDEGSPVDPVEITPLETTPPEVVDTPEVESEPEVEEPTPVQATPAPAPGTMPCASGLLPLGLVSLAGLWLRRRI